MYKLSDALGLGNITFNKECYCEWCIKGSEIPTMLWSDGNFWYCISCAKEHYDFKVTDEEIEGLKKSEIKAKIKYHKQKIEELNEELEE